MSLFNLEDPQSVGLLSLGLRLMSTPGGLGQALGQSGLGAMGDIRATQQAQQQAQMAKLQIDHAKREAEQAAEAQRRQKVIEQAAMFATRTPQQMALSGGGGPTIENAAKIDVNAPPQLDPHAFVGQLFKQGLPMEAVDYQGKLAKQAPALQAFKPGEVVGTNQNGKFVPTFTVPNTEAKGTSDMQNYAAAKLEGFGGSFTDFLREQANLKAPKTHINVPINMGQKGYENESKLRNDFKSEPIYKDFADMQSAHKQIKAGLSQGTPIGDVAVATKIMKLLDPGSVVRESELGIAMAASGRMDRLKNYMQMQMSGEKLTPQMRKDFGALADELMAAATQSYNAKRSEYASMGARYGLDESVLGPAFKAPKPSGDVRSEADAIIRGK